MATKTKAAAKPAAKKAAPKHRTAPKKTEAVVVESVHVHTFEPPQGSAVVVVINEKHAFAMSTQMFLNLRREFNDQAAGLVH